MIMIAVTGEDGLVHLALLPNHRWSDVVNGRNGWLHTLCNQTAYQGWSKSDVATCFGCSREEAHWLSQLDDIRI